MLSGTCSRTIGAGAGTREWAFAAHMDHPGWVRGKNSEMTFLGSVPERFRINPKTRSFGDFAMWDLPPFEIRDGQIHSRACDDLLGCAEIICVFRELEERRAAVHCVGLFTRAEEVGFVGAIKLAQSDLLPRHVTILSLETSTPRGTAEIGKGPIVRVGDRVSSFDGPATAKLLAVAQRRRFLCNAACLMAEPAKRPRTSFTVTPARRPVWRLAIITTAPLKEKSRPNTSRSTTSSGWCGFA